MKMTLVYCVFVEGELARVFSTEDLAERYLECIREEAADGYYTAVPID